MSGMGDIWRQLLGIAVGGAWVLTASCVSAQIIPDRTLPSNSSVTINGSTFNITGGTQAGRNLFHSFQQFSVPTGGTASFNNALDIQNIISRVTGGSISNIDGLIRANGTANLFFINPQGIVFGQNARLDLGGSFVASTANSLKFADGFEFSATAPLGTSLLTISVPIGLQYGANPGSITNQSIAVDANNNPVGLMVPSGNSLALVGGEVSLDGGRLTAAGGRVELGGLTEAGTVGLQINGNKLSLSFPALSTRASVSLTNGANADVTAGGGGNIAVNARNLDLMGGSTLTAGIGQDLGSVGSQAGNITLNATGEIKVVGEGSGVMNNVRSKAVGNGGDINIITGSLAVDGARIGTSTFGQGNAGNLTIAAPEQVSFTNGAFGLTTAESGSVGNGGDISIQAGSVSVTNGSQLKASTLGRGNSGNLTIDARNSVEFMNGAFAFSQVQGGMGNGGEMRISTDSLLVTNGSQLSASTLGEGNAGTLRIDARDTVSFTNGGGALTTVEPGAIGNGNDLRIQARSVLVSSGSFLSAKTLGQGNAGNVIIDARDSVRFDNGRALSEVDSLGVGNGADISITTGSLSLLNGAQLSTSNRGQRGNAGNVTINAQDSISFDGSSIFSSMESPGVGNSGNISISTAIISLTNGSQLFSSNRGQGNAGNVAINSRDGISFNGASIFSNVESPQTVGNGGDISIITGSLSLTNGAQLSTSNRGQRGNAGNVTINARDSISFDGSSIFSSVESPGIGNGGDISITTGSLFLNNGAQLFTTNRGQGGNAGNVAINSRDGISFNGGSIFSSVESPLAVGKAGDISIITGSVSLTNGAQLFARNSGRGNAGNVTINARDSISFDGSSIFSSVESPGIGNGGDISITTGSLFLNNGAQLFTTNRGQGGNAGNVAINSRDGISFNGGSIFSSVESPLAVGKAGDISIITGSVSLTNGAQLFARNSGRGNAGNVTINARDSISFDGSSIFSSVESPGIGNGGDISITTGSLFLNNGAQLFTTNRGQGGNAGNVAINSRDGISFNGGSIFSSVESPLAVGKAGDISIITGSVSLTNGAQLFARNSGRGNAGNVTINARDSISFDGSSIFSSVESPGIGNGGDISITTGSLFLNNGAQLFTTNRGQGGNAGNVTINARDRISFNGASIFSSIESQVVGNVRNTSTTTGSLTLTDGVQTNANNQVQRTAGDIQIRSRSIQLDNKANIQAITTSGNGGNITLNSQNFLLLRRNSQISTTAGTVGAGGDGGNIIINTPFVIAVPNENSDITANAFSGRGGNVDINTQGNFFIAPLSRSELESRLMQIAPSLPLDPSLLTTNDITAISQTGPTLNGIVQINTPDIDRSRELIKLPTKVVDISNSLVSSSCANFNETANGNQFTITGRGGVPPSPDEPLTSDVVWLDTRLPVTTEQHQRKTHAAKSKPQPIAIVPATGWVFNDKGEVTLISSVSNPTSINTPTSCPAR